MNRARGFAGIIGAIVLCSTLPVFAGTPVTVTVTGPGTAIPVPVGSTTEYAGVYAGYTTPSFTNQGLICDDFTSQISPPQTWNAIAYQVSTIGVTTPLTALLYGGTLSPTYLGIGLNGYAALAYLVNDSFNHPGDTAQQALDNLAIWSITDPGLAVGAAALAQAQVAVNYATSTSNSFSAYTNLYVFTPDPLTLDNVSNKQEMWGTVPEGGSALMYLLLAGIFCFGAGFFRNRFATLKA